MSDVAIALVLASTFMHAGWNLLARRGRREAACFQRMLSVVTLVGLAPAVVSEWLTRSITPTAWWCVLGSGICCALYYLFLSLGYRSGDFTVVYPMARALPVLLVAVADVVRGRQPTWLGWVGVLLVSCGCVLAPLRRLRDFHPREYFNRLGLWIVLTALGTVGYTLLDKIAAESVTRGPATAARYGVFFFGVSWVCFTGLRRLTDGRAAASGTVGWGQAAAAAACNFGAYWLVLWAYQLARRASYIVAFRQFSIVIGVALAFLLYKESGWRVRLSATALITGGLVAIGIGG